MSATQPSKPWFFEPKNRRRSRRSRLQQTAPRSLNFNGFSGSGICRFFLEESKPLPNSFLRGSVVLEDFFKLSVDL